MSVLGEAAHLTDLRAGLGYGGYGYGLGYGQPETVLPLWRPHVNPPPSVYCLSPSCPCSLTNSFGSRPYMMADYYDYQASLVQSWPSWYLKAVQDPLYKGPPPPPPPPPLDRRESPCKELPTKILKQERIKERLELSQPLNFDKDHALKHSRKCAGTQTQLSNISHDLYANGESSPTSAELYSVRHSLLTQTITNPGSGRSSSPRFQHDLHDAPLNLSLSNSSPNSSGDSPTQSRPSVITCASTKPSGTRYENGAHSPNRREASSVTVCESTIEEHFRRSLGRNYPEFLAPKPSQPSPPPTPPEMVTPAVSSSSKNNMTALSITGSVDDHFAKSLGNSTWSAIKAKSDPVQELMPGSVDDHFAKALGDTWLRIKAEKEGVRAMTGLPLPPPYPHPHPITIPHQHTNPHSHPPRPSSPQSQKMGSSMLST